MARPHKLRHVFFRPGHRRFVPLGPIEGSREEITLSLDELEALRLADLEGLYQEEAAKHMKISRQTFGNIVQAAHRKVAEFLVHSRTLAIEGGHTRMMERQYHCRACGHGWSVPRDQARAAACPVCTSPDIHRIHADRTYVCDGCGHAWSVPRDQPDPEGCPECRGMDLQRIKFHRHGYRREGAESSGENPRRKAARQYRCATCGYRWALARQEGRAQACPQCHGDQVARMRQQEGAAADRTAP